MVHHFSRERGPKNEIVVSLSYMQKSPGTRDMDDDKLKLRSDLKVKLYEVYRSYGATDIETPIMELTDTLQKKYGDDEKLIFDLKSHRSSLRYDLTVPLLRYCGENGIDSGTFMHGGKVFRMDSPNPSKLRFCEFEQHDIDFLNQPDNIMTDIKVLSVGVTYLNQLKIPFKIKFSYKFFLFDMIKDVGITDQKQMMSICSSIDALDKKPWKAVQVQLIEKGLSEDQCATLEKKLCSNTEFSSPLVDRVFKFAKIMGFDANLEFDISLARGMDYYSGLIFEFYCPDFKECGTIISGGRYDLLSNMLLDKDISLIGLSVGFDRVAEIYERLYPIVKEPVVKSYLCMLRPPGTSECSMELCEYLMTIYSKMTQNKSEICVLSTESKSISKHQKYALRHGFSLMYIVGEKEMNDGKLIATLKQLQNKTQVTVEFI